MLFQNRAHAGEKLAKELKLLQLHDPIVLAIPRGGVPVGGAIAKALRCAFDVIPLMKIPIPWSPEASYGVVAMDGTLALNVPLVNRLELSERELDMAAKKVLEEAKRRDQRYRQGRPFPELANRTVIITDDGLASGYSMLAAVGFVKKKRPRQLIVASPIAADVAQRLIKADQGVDTMIILALDSAQVFSLSSYYKDFKALTDDDVRAELASAGGG